MSCTSLGLYWALHTSLEELGGDTGIGLVMSNLGTGSAHEPRVPGVQPTPISRTVTLGVTVSQVQPPPLLPWDRGWQTHGPRCSPNLRVFVCSLVKSVPKREAQRAHSEVCNRVNILDVGLCV